MISCYHLTVPDPHGDTPIFDDVGFEVDDGEWVEIVGPSGAGKSLLYAILALERRPRRGKVVVAGRNLDRMDRAGLAALRQDLGTCRQRVALLEERTVIENLVLPLVVRGETNRAAQVAERLLETVGWSHLRDRPAGSLSVGRQRAVGILRAVIGAPRIVAVDGSLDTLQKPERDASLRLLRDAHARGSAILLFGQNSTGVSDKETTEFRLEGGELKAKESAVGQS